MNKNADFTRGPIVGPLIRFSLPILLALFLQALYGAVDLMVVGQYARAEDVSGVAVGSQIMMTITNLISSFAMGSTILLGQKIGEGDRKSGGRIIGTSIVLFLGTGVLLTVLIPAMAGNMATAMQAPAEAFAQTKRYISICGAGSVMIVAYNVLGSIMRGIGDSRTPLMTVAIASVCNIAGDECFCRTESRGRKAGASCAGAENGDRDFDGTWGGDVLALLLSWRYSVQGLLE